MKRCTVFALVMVVALALAAGMGGAATKPAAKSEKIAGVPMRLQAAYAAFVKKDMKGAATQIRAAAAAMYAEAAAARQEAKKPLSDSGKALADLAGRVEKGAVKSAKELQLNFARADDLAARYHHAMARDAYMSQKQAEAGAQLQKAMIALEQGTRFVGYKMEAAEQATLKQARTVVDQLAKGAQVAQGDATKAWSDVGQGIKKLSQSLAPKPK
jgi:hypothetical protein